MSIHTILSQMEEEFDNLFLAGDKGKTSWVSENLLKLCSVFVGYSPVHGSTNQTFGNKEAQMVKPYTDEIKKFIHSFATRIVEEAQREERERIQQKLQELWSKDPRSVEGKKQGNTDAWMMGYRTAQKEISLTLAPSYRR